MYCGIDVSKNRSLVCILEQNSNVIKEFEIKHTKEGIEKLKKRGKHPKKCLVAAARKIAIRTYYGLIQ